MTFQRQTSKIFIPLFFDKNTHLYSTMKKKYHENQSIPVCIDK
jgi:hypothetical protein